MLTRHLISFLTEVDPVEHVWFNLCWDLIHTDYFIRSVTLPRFQEFVQRYNLSLVILASSIVSLVQVCLDNSDTCNSDSAVTRNFFGRKNRARRLKWVSITRFRYNSETFATPDWSELLRHTCTLLWYLRVATMHSPRGRVIIWRYSLVTVIPLRCNTPTENCVENRLIAAGSKQELRNSIY